MLKKIKHHFLPLFVILLISLTPFVWLRNDYIILGHDAGTPISPTEHFLDRTEVWTYRYGGGSDQTFAVPGFFIHGFEFLLDKIPTSLSNQQKIEFSIYMFLIGLSMYISVILVFEGITAQFALISAIIYECNHFILQAWFIAERTKFSVYIALPVLTALIFLTMQKRIKPQLAGILSGCILTIFNGGGFLPLYASVFLSIGLILLLSIIKNFKKENLLLISIYLITFILTYFIGNLYWLLPYYWYLHTNFSQLVTEAGGISGVINWVNAISQNTSFLNLFRLQGIQEWYVNSEHPYSYYYFSNPILILASFTPLVILLLTLKKLKDKKNFYVLILFLVLLASIFLMAGSHKPFGFLYILLLKYIPGFIAFRTPYYKFAPAFYLSFSFIVGYFFWQVLETKKHKFIFTACILMCYLLYNFPFFTVNFFQYAHDRTTKVIPPEYVFEYASYIQKNPDNLVRTALFPGLNISDATSQYSWGYWSLAPLHSLLDRHQYLLPQKANSLETELIQELYTDLYEKNDEWIEIAKLLGIDSILIENDFTGTGVYTSDIKNVTSYMDRDPRVHMLQQFEPWKMYKISDENVIHNNYIEVHSKPGKIGEINRIGNYLFNNLQLKNPLAILQEKNDNLNRLGLIVKADCQDCQLLREQVYTADPNIVFLPGTKLSFLAKFLGIDYKLNSTPANLLQRLYIQQTLIKRKLPGELRLPVWQEYLDYLEKYKEEIHTAINEKPINHSLMISKLSNIQLQIELLKDLSVFVNSPAEAELFIKATREIQELEQVILSTTVVTIDKNHYKLTVTPPEDGKYLISLYNDLLNANGIGKPINLSVNNSTVSAEILSKNTWTNMGEYNLSNKEYEIDIFDQNFYFDGKYKSDFTLGENQTCQNILSRDLPTGIYNLEFNITSLGFNSNITTHIIKSTENNPLLPYWGHALETPQNILKKAKLIFNVEEAQNVTIFVCGFTLKDANSFKLQDLEINRQTNPIVLLYKQDNLPTLPSGNYSISRKDNTHNVYTVSASSSGVLNTLHPVNNNWLISGFDTEKNIRINDGMQGLIVPSGEYSINETYTIQKYYKLGASISAAGITLIVLYLLTFHFQRKKL